MNRRTDIARAAIAILAACMFMAFTSGCIPEDEHLKEIELRKSVQRLLEESISTNSSLLDMRAKLQDELLKANIEIAACWKIIGDTKPDPNSPPVWGEGDLPPAWLDTFGNGNDSRMNFVQSQAITELAKRLRVLEINQYVPDPNEVK